METEFERKLDLKLIMSVIAAGLMSFTGVVVATAMNGECIINCVSELTAV